MLLSKSFVFCTTDEHGVGKPQPIFTAKTTRHQVPMLPTRSTVIRPQSSVESPKTEDARLWTLKNLSNIFLFSTKSRFRTGVLIFHIPNRDNNCAPAGFKANGRLSLKTFLTGIVRTFLGNCVCMLRKRVYSSNRTECNRQDENRISDCRRGREHAVFLYRRRVGYLRNTSKKE